MKSISEGDCHRGTRVLSRIARLVVIGALAWASLTAVGAAADGPAEGVNGSARAPDQEQIFTVEAKLLPTPDLNASNANFGRSVAVDGDFMVVGLIDHVNGLDVGAAHVFQRHQGGPDAWGQVAKITPAGGRTENEFGFSVAISGDTVVVGAYLDDDNGYRSGSAYVFQRDHGGLDAWGQVAKITPGDGSAGDLFGYSVAISGDTTVVGAIGAWDNGWYSGLAYVFQRDQGGNNAWGWVATISPAGGENDDEFGYSVSIDGDIAIVGARHDNDNGYHSGSAYVVSRDQGGVDAWGQVAKITAADGAINDEFGFSVAISGDTAVVGARENDSNGTNSGSAYVFQRDHGGVDAWGQVAKITAADGAAYDDFGRSVSASGDTVVVGAPGDDDSGNWSGSAYIFGRDHGGPNLWGQVSKITPADSAENDVFGESVAIRGDTAVGGAPGDDDLGSDSGSASIYQRDHGGTAVWGEVTKVPCPPAFTARGDFFGQSVSINGDTALVGARGDDDNGPSSGSAYVFQRGQGGTGAWGQAAKITDDDGAEDDSFGHSVAISGDTAVVGAVGDDDNGSGSGSAYIYQRDHGAPDAWGQVAKIIPTDGAERDFFGHSVAISGDTAVVGAYGDDDIGYGSGSAYVFRRDFGGPDSWGQVAKITADDGAAGDEFGTSVSISGDTAIVGARFDEADFDRTGAAYTFRRDHSGPEAWGQVAKVTPVTSWFYEQFGCSVSISGDTAVVGESNSRHSGWAFIFQRDQGGTDAWGQVVKRRAADAANNDHFGFSVAISGDTVVIGAFGDDDNGTISGSASVFQRDQGGADAWGQTSKITAPDGATGDELGRSVAISGVAAFVGAPKNDDLGEDAGSAYVFAISDAFFADGFETGDTAAWSVTVP